MFWTAFLWGLGMSCGGSIGLLLFAVGFKALQWLTGQTERLSRLEQFNRETLAALNERNALTQDTNATLTEIVSAVYHRERRNRD